MKRSRYYVWSLVLLCYYNLRPDLDGRFGPTIIVENTYTFTPNERALGFVEFQQGFDIPANGTVELLLAPGMVVDGQIKFNGGTLRIFREVTFGARTSFQGHGFLLGGGAIMYFMNDIVLGASFFMGDNGMRIVAPKKRTLFFGVGGSIDLTRVTSFFIDNFRVILSGEFNDRIITSSSAPATMNFIDCNLTGGATFRNPLTQFSGESSLSTNGKLVFEQDVDIAQRSELLVKSGTRMEVGGLDLSFFNSDFILDSSTLDCKKPSATSDTISVGGTSGGRFSVMGRSILRASAGNPLTIKKNQVTQFLPGAQLSIDTGTKLSIID